MERLKSKIAESVAIAPTVTVRCCYGSKSFPSPGKNARRRSRGPSAAAEQLLGRPWATTTTRRWAWPARRRTRRSSARTASWRSASTQVRAAGLAGLWGALQQGLTGHWTDKNLDDKAEAERKFKEIGEAYSVLSDEQKRRQYDRFGRAGVAGAAAGPGANAHPFQGQDAEEIFRAFFGGQDPFSMFFQEAARGPGGGVAHAGGFGGSRVHVSQFGPGFTFTSFGAGPGMRMHRVNQRQRCGYACVCT